MPLSRTLALLGSLALASAGCRSTTSGVKAPAGHAAARTQQPPPPADSVSPVPDRAEDVRPLDVGARAPGSPLRDAEGRSVDLAGLMRQRPTALIFYRGGWCPYCNTHLGQLAKVEGQLVEMGYQVLAVSPDRPEEIRQTLEGDGYRYRVLSDSDMRLARSFGLAFRVDDSTVQRYRGFGIDLERSSGQGHHLLPVPAVYLIDRGGTIRFAHWDADYKKRLSGAELVNAARSALAR